MRLQHGSVAGRTGISGPAASPFPGRAVRARTLALLAVLALLLMVDVPSVIAQEPITDDNPAPLAVPEGHVEAAAPASMPAEELSAFTLLSVLAAPISLAIFYWRRWQKLDGKRLRERPFEPVVGLGLLFMLFAASALGSVLAHQFFFDYEGDVAAMPLNARMKFTVLGLAGMYVGQAVVLVLAWNLIRPPHSKLPKLHRPAVSVPVAAALGVGALVLFWPLVVSAGLAASKLQELLVKQHADQIAHETLAMLVEAPADGWRTALVVLVVIGPAVFEEIFYRGILHRMLRAMLLRPWPAVFITSAVFTLMHANVAQPQALVALFVLSLGLGWIYERTGRIAAPMAMHMMFNLANAALALMATA